MSAPSQASPSRMQYLLLEDDKGAVWIGVQVHPDKTADEMRALLFDALRATLGWSLRDAFLDQPPHPLTMLGKRTRTKE